MDAIPNLPTRVLDSHRQPMNHPSTAEREQHRARLGNTQRLSPELNARYAVIPILAHERESIGRVGNDRVNGVFIHRTHRVAAVAVDHFPLRHRRLAAYALPIPQHTQAGVAY